MPSGKLEKGGLELNETRQLLIYADNFNLFIENKFQKEKNVSSVSCW
jgi:hypothetical protein